MVIGHSRQGKPSGKSESVVRLCISLSARTASYPTRPGSSQVLHMLLFFVIGITSMESPRPPVPSFCILLSSGLKSTIRQYCFYYLYY